MFLPLTLVTSPGITGNAPAERVGYEQTGRASWYGHPYHGRRTANGEIYDMHRLTAAHRTLPLGTRVRVTNLRNGRVVDVRVNDRGPYVDGRILDLSHAAASVLDAVRDGVVPVRLEVLELPARVARRGRELRQSQR
ncbi:MAG: septal ring lytic transglycosylase RlpA family protein [Candidatus Rokuibacteriota bacterium]